MHPGALREMERLGVKAEALEQALQAAPKPSPFADPADFPYDAPLAPPLDLTVDWLRFTREPWDRNVFIIQIPDQSSYRVRRDKALVYLREMHHPDPENIVALVDNFRDAIWFVQANIYHRVSEADRRRSAWERGF